MDSRAVRWTLGALDGLYIERNSRHVQLALAETVHLDNERSAAVYSTYAMMSPPNSHSPSVASIKISPASISSGQSPSIPPICTGCCFKMTNMIQACSNFHEARVFIINTHPAPRPSGSVLRQSPCQHYSTRRELEPLASILKEKLQFPMGAE